MSHPQGHLSPRESLQRMLAGKWLVQAIATAAELGIADALHTPQTSDELARRLGCHEEALRRLLRPLCGEGLFELDRQGRYHLTALGAELKNEAQRDLARFVGSASQWTPWAELSYTIRTGNSAFERVHGKGLYEYLKQSPEDAEVYNRAVDSFTLQHARALAHSEELSNAQEIVDVGGGRGTLLLELLQRNAELRGVLVDRADVVRAAKPRFAEHHLLERCRFIGGDFFEVLPSGADCYVLKHVLHNWSDPEAIRLLSLCAERMAGDGVVIVVEGLLLPDRRPHLTQWLDLEMLVLTGSGKERSKPEFRRLFHQAGLKLESTHSLGERASALIAVRR